MSLYRLYTFAAFVSIAKVSLVSSRSYYTVNANNRTSISHMSIDNKFKRTEIEYHTKYPKPIKCPAQSRVAIPYECEKYFHCSKVGQRATIVRCEQNKMFHHQKRSCFRMAKKECESTMCQTASQTFPDPYSKHSYLSCANMYPEVVACPTGQIYDITDGACKGSSVTVWSK